MPSPSNYVWGAEVVSGARDWALGFFPFAGPWQEAALHRRALEFAFPLIAVPGPLADKTLAHDDYLRLDNPHVHLTALYRAEGRLYARLFNGSAATQVVPRPAFPPGVPLVPVDLWSREHPAAAAAEIAGSPDVLAHDIRLRPWEIQTLRLG